MSAEQQGLSEAKATGDPLIEDVRAVRREMCEQFGNDVDRLIEHLRGVESEYEARHGVFAGVSKEAAQRVLAGWGEGVLRTDDPIVDEVRAIRKGLAEQGPQGCFVMAQSGPVSNRRFRTGRKAECPRSACSHEAASKSPETLSWDANSLPFLAS